jgi:hypothetical protein
MGDKYVLDGGREVPFTIQTKEEHDKKYEGMLDQSNQTLEKRCEILEKQVYDLQKCLMLLHKNQHSFEKALIEDISNGLPRRIS